MHRHAVRYSHRSRVWESIIFVFTRTLPTLFDCYVDPADAPLDLSLCIEEPICSDFILLLSKSYSRDPNLIKNHFSQALSVIEHLLVQHHVREVRYFLDQAILSHFEAVVDVEAFVQMLVRACPLIPIEQRNETCKSVLSDVAYKLGRTKLPRKSAPILFDFALTLLDLCVLQAPPCAVYLLEKKEFYPWKDLSARFTDLLRLCAAYDTIDLEARSSELDSLTTILKIVADRAKAFPVIFRATHNEALRNISRWAYLHTNSSDSRKIWPGHVYRMGEAMFFLIDERQVTIDLCVQLIEGLRTRITDNESVDDDRSAPASMSSFFLVSHSCLLVSLDTPSPC